MASLKDWGEIAASPLYQNASDDQKAEMEVKYKNAGGVIPQARSDESSLRQLGSFLGDAVQSGANTVSHDVARGVAGLVQMGDRAANAALGMEPSSLSTYGRRMEQNSDTLYKKRQAEIQSDSARSVGEFGGRIVGDVGAMIAAPGVAIPGIAAREMGNAYANQKDGQENLTDAVNVGGATFLANSLLPGAGGRAAEGLIGRSMDVARDAGRNALVGAGGGLATGAAREANDNPNADVGDIIGGSLEEAAAGAAFGGAFGAASNLLTRGGKAAQDVVNNMNPNSQRNIADQAEIVANAKSSDDLVNAYSTAGQYNAVRGSQILADRGVPLLDSRLANDADGMAAFGKTQDDIVKSMDAHRDSATNTMIPFVTNKTDAGKMAVTRDEIERGGKSLVGDVTTSLDSAKNNVDRMVEKLNNSYGERATEAGSYGSAIREELTPINNFKQAFGDYVTAMKRDKGQDNNTFKETLDRAKEAQDAFDSTPDYFKNDFLKSYKGVDGFTEGFNPVAHAAEYNAAYQQLHNMHPSFRNASTNPTQGRSADNVPKSLLDVVGTTKDALLSGRARSQLRAEKDRNLAQVRQLARGDLAVAKSRNATEAARAEMEQTPIEDTTPEMEYSQPEPTPTPEPEVVRPQPDQGLVRAPRRNEPVIDEPVPEQQIVAPEIDQTLVRSPRRPTEEPVIDEPVPEQQIVAPEPTPREVDQTLVRSPRRPVQDEPAPVQEPVVEPEAPRTVDQEMVRTPRRPVEEEAPVQQEQVVEPEPTPEPTPEVDQTLARDPRRASNEEPVAEPTSEPEPARIDPREAVDFQTGATRSIEQRQLNSVKNRFTTDAVKDQITPENMNDPHFLQQMRREDVANNVESLHHSVEQVNKARKIREAKQHELNVKELDRWAKEYGIPSEFIDQAIKAKGLSHSNILGISDIKVRAEKMFERSLKPKSDGSMESVPQEAPEQWRDQRENFFNDVSKMHGDVQKSAMPMINQAFKAAEKTDTPLTPSEVRSLWKKIYNQEAEVNKKLGKKKEAEESERKAKEQEENAQAKADREAAEAEKLAKSRKVAKDIQNLHDLSVQTDKIQQGMRKELEGKDLSEKDINDFIDAHMDRNFGVTTAPLGDRAFQEAATKARNAAQRFANKSEAGMTPAEKEMEISGSTGPLSEANPELEALHKQIDELQKKVKGAKSDDVKDTQDAVSGEIVDRAEKALKDGDSLDEVVEAAELLSKVYYGKDSPAGYSLRQYARMMQKSKSYSDTYPDQPALWLSSDDVGNIAKSNSPHANGLKSKLVRTVLGKNLDEVKLLTNADREKYAVAVDRGEITKQIPLNKVGRAALLGTDKPKVKVKRKGGPKPRRLNLRRD